jgi:Helix-turn-helix domain
MPSALSTELRLKIVELYAKGNKLLDVCEHLHLSYCTVRKICKRYQEEGQAALKPHYHNCGRPRAQPCGALIYRAALWLKRLHHQWGAALILVKLKARYHRKTLPGERTLQRWFHAAGLYKTKTSLPAPKKRWAKRVHDTWQMDAKEKLHLASGQKACYLTVVDEKSGCLLRAFVFPPLPY